MAHSEDSPRDSPREPTRHASPPEPAAPRPAAEVLHESTIDRQVRLRTRRAFLGLGAAGLVGALGWRWLLNTPPVDGVAGGLRAVLDFNGEVASAYFKRARLAPEFPASAAEKLRFNGRIGLGADFDPLTWRLRVRRYAAPGSAPREDSFTLADIRALPRTEFTTEFKCIEGWSRLVTWGGVRLGDFLNRYPLATRSEQAVSGSNAPPADLAPYVSLATPDKKYFVGLDIDSALHPQTLLCYEMNGAPLTLRHGAPLRLVVPVKYGIKYIKRIGEMAFIGQRPADYWAERGYDWHAGH